MIDAALMGEVCSRSRQNKLFQPRDDVFAAYEPYGRALDDIWGVT